VRVAASGKFAVRGDAPSLVSAQVNVYDASMDLVEQLVSNGQERNMVETWSGASNVSIVGRNHTKKTKGSQNENEKQNSSRKKLVLTLS
jgi:hypothetical protein